LIDVRATALNRADLLQRRGLYPPPAGASEILGLECSGVVAARGPSADRFAVGARVMALLAGGGYAEQVVVHEGVALPVPERLSFEQAAAVPEAFLTAGEALLVEAELRRGHAVLVTAALSGVGSAAVQIAKLRGAFVIGCASASKLPALSGLGADLALDREREDFVDAVREATGRRGVDAIVDFVGGGALARHQACLAERGRLVAIGLLGGASGALDLGRLVMKRQQLRGLVMRTRSTLEKIELVQRFERELLPALAAGEISPQLDRAFPLAEVAAAHVRMEQNLNSGKIVLRLSG
jgi:putative PIG3 family NAD(P)H quinone oxidoreductase